MAMAHDHEGRDSGLYIYARAIEASWDGKLFCQLAGALQQHFCLWPKSDDA